MGIDPALAVFVRNKHEAIEAGVAAVGLFSFIRTSIREIKRVFTGEILRQEDIEIGGGLRIVSLLLKQERHSRNEYIVFVGRSAGRIDYTQFEPDEFDRFIEAADEIRASQTSATGASSNAVSRLDDLVGMISNGEILRRIDTKISDGYVTITLQLKRDRASAYEYVVLGTTAPGWYLYYSFELIEFHRFVAAAKRIRATERNSPSDELRQA